MKALPSMSRCPADWKECDIKQLERELIINPVGGIKTEK
jgi:hypothetical protein